MKFDAFLVFSKMIYIHIISWCIWCELQTRWSKLDDVKVIRMCAHKIDGLLSLESIKELHFQNPIGLIFNVWNSTVSLTTVFFFIFFQFFFGGGNLDDFASEILDLFPFEVTNYISKSKNQMWVFSLDIGGLALLCWFFFSSFYIWLINCHIVCVSYVVCVGSVKIILFFIFYIWHEIIKEH